MLDITVFNYQDTQVRTVSIDGELHFVAADVCKVLEISNPSDALKRLDDDERTLVLIEGASNGLKVNGVTESGLYSLILSSRKPEAKAFKRWVTHEILRAIRKTGRYELAKLSPAEMLLATAQQLVSHERLLAEQSACLTCDAETYIFRHKGQWPKH